MNTRLTDKIKNNEKILLEDVKPNDRKNGYPLHVPEWYTRIFETIPGAITWFFLALPFLAAFFGFPEFMVWYVAFLTLYWGYRSFKFVYGIFIAYFRMNRDVKTDWIERIEKEGLNRDHLKYVYILPIYKEGYDVIEPTIDAWSKSDVGADRISVVFALEQRAIDISKPVVEKIISKYGKLFRETIISIHPKDIEGEIVGVKNPNINWATRLFVEKVQERNEKLDDYLLITCDSDLRPHPKYLSAITYKFLLEKEPHKKFYSTAIHTFNNNVYNVPSLVRIFSHFLSLVIMNEWVTRKKTRETWSSYVASLRTVHEIGYWDPEIPNDDTAFYFNALIRYNGEFAGEEVYIPTYSDAVENKDFINTHKALYKQQLRWGWGSIVFPMTFAGLYKNKNIPLKKKLEIALPMFDDRLLFRTTVYLITFALPILTLLSPGFKFSSASYNLPRIMSTILTAIVFLNIPIYFVKTKLSPRPKNWNIIRIIGDVLETILITVNLLTFAFIPYVQAWTEMMLGKSKKQEYYVTDKVSIKK